MYLDQRTQIMTGDPIFFSGEGFESDVIKAITGSDKSHIGMAVVAPLNMVLCMESTRLLDGKSGVQVNFLSDRVRDYDGTLSTKNLFIDRDVEFYNVLEQGFGFMRGREYERSILELAFSACKEPIGGEDFSSIFCSEMLAYFYKLWKCLPADVPANSYTPGEIFDAKLIRGKFGPERILKAA